MNNMKEEKKKRWEEVITSTNMTHNSRKAWQTINLSNNPSSSTPNQTAVQHKIVWAIYTMNAADGEIKRMARNRLVC